MKTCPVCGCLAFDDAETCFGCLHPFSDEEAAVSERSAPQKQNRAGECPARFVVSFAPSFEDGRTIWSCSVEAT